MFSFFSFLSHLHSVPDAAWIQSKRSLDFQMLLRDQGLQKAEGKLNLQGRAKEAASNPEGSSGVSTIHQSSASIGKQGQVGGLSAARPCQPQWHKPCLRSHTGLFLSHNPCHTSCAFTWNQHLIYLLMLRLTLENLLKYGAAAQ